MIKGIKRIFAKIIDIIQNPVMSILPGQLAFSFILTLIPILILIALVANMVGLSLDTIIDFITKSFPTQVSELFVPLIDGKGFDISILFFLIMAIWLSSNGAYAIITASDLVYDLKPQKYIPKKVKSIIMTFLLIAIVIFMLVMLAFGDLILKWLGGITILTNVILKVSSVYTLIKYPLSFIMIYFGIKLIYTIAPNKVIPSSSVTLGSLFTSIMWIIVTVCYSLWVNNAHYDIFYGSISNILVLLIWTWFLAYIFAIGLLINSGIEKNNNNK